MSNDLEFAYEIRRYAVSHFGRNREAKAMMLEAADIIEKQHAKLNPNSALSELWAYFDDAVKNGDQASTRQALHKIAEVKI